MSAYATIVLDTAPPVLQVNLVPDVEPPDDLTFDVLASEPDDLVAFFTDAANQVWQGSVIVLSPTRKIVTFTSPDLSRGEGTLSITAVDDVLNSTLYEQSVMVVKPRVYDTDTWEQGGYDVKLRMDLAYDTETETLPPFGVVVGQEMVYEVEASTQGVYDTRTRSTESGE